MNLAELSTLLYDSLVYLVLAFVIFFVGKLVYQALHPSISVKEELVKKDNLAFSLAHVGYFVGLLLAIGGAIVGPTKGLVQDITEISIYGVLGIVLLNLSVFITDKIILKNFSVKKEIVGDQNAGVGVLEGAVSVASGLIILGAVTGESNSMLAGILSAVSFWFIGQIALVLTSLIYNSLTPYCIHEHLEKDNVAVGVGYAGALIAMANLIRFGISGGPEGGESLISEYLYLLGSAGIEIVIGLILLPVMRFITDKILLPGENLSDEIVNQEKPNVGAAIIEAFAYIGGSVLITWCL